MPTDHPLDFNNHFLDHILVNCILHTNFLNKIRSVLDPKIFKSKERKLIINLVYDYYDEYKEAPNDHFYDLFEDRKPFITDALYTNCNKLIEILSEIQNSNQEYILQTIRQAIAHFAMEEGIIKAAQLVKAKKYDDAKQIMLEAFKEPEKVEKSYYDFLNDNEFIERRSKGKIYKMKSLIEPLDKEIGGFNNWLVTILGATKGGKTKWLIELAVAGALQGKNVLFVSLEMNAPEIEDGLDQAIGFLGSEPGKTIEVIEKKKNDWVKIKKVVPTIFDLDLVNNNRKALRRQGGRIIVSDKSATRFNYLDLHTLVNQIEQEQGIIFDEVVIDYLGEMGPTEKKQNKKDMIAANASGLFRFSKEKCCLVVTAQQGNRAAMRAKVFKPDLISDSIEPIFISDLVLAICQTEKEERLNIYRMFLALFRHGPKGIFIPLVRDTNIGAIALGSPSKRQMDQSQEEDENEKGTSNNSESDDY